MASHACRMLAAPPAVPSDVRKRRVPARSRNPRRRPSGRRPPGCRAIAAAGHRQAGLDVPHGLQARADAFQNLVLGRHHRGAEARHDDRVEPGEPLQPGQHPGMNAVARKPAECGDEREMRDQRHRGVLAQHPNAAQSNRHRVDEERIGAFRDREIVEVDKPVHLIGDIGQIHFRNAGLTLRPAGALRPTPRRARRAGTSRRRPASRRPWRCRGRQASFDSRAPRKAPADSPMFGLMTPKKIGPAEGLQPLAQTGDAEPAAPRMRRGRSRESGCPAAGSGECRARRTRLRRRRRTADWECAARNCRAGGRW